MGVALAELFGWEGNYKSGVTPGIYHRPCGTFTSALNVLYAYALLAAFIVHFNKQ